MSGSRSRRKGRVWENAVVRWLREHGFPWVKHNEYLDASEGDILNIEGWSIECKNHKEMKLSSWVDQAATQAAEAGVERYAVVIKRPRTTDVGQAYVVMPLEVFAAWLQE